MDDIAAHTILIDLIWEGLCFAFPLAEYGPFLHFFLWCFGSSLSCCSFAQLSICTKVQKSLSVSTMPAKTLVFLSGDKPIHEVGACRCITAAAAGVYQCNRCPLLWVLTIVFDLYMCVCPHHYGSGDSCVLVHCMW
eukprot:564513-Amphidinium_carterae.1